MKNKKNKTKKEIFSLLIHKEDDTPYQNYANIIIIIENTKIKDMIINKGKGRNITSAGIRAVWEFLQTEFGFFTVSRELVYQAMIRVTEKE